ncbi:MAG: hypothetical protein ACR2L2_08465 [Acidobacteriota bacterium]
MNQKQMIGADFISARRAMPRRQFLSGVSVPLALLSLNALTPAASHTANTIPLERKTTANGRNARNTIELRSGSAGDQYFFCFVRPDVIAPQKKYRLENKLNNTWAGTAATRNGRALPESILWPIEVEYEKPDGMSTGGKHPYLDLDTIAAEHNSIKYVACDKYTSGCNLSHTFQDHQKDWDFLEHKLAEILTAAGLTDKASDYEKVRAVARFCIQTRKGKKNSSRYVHPVDFCIHGSFCVGAANTLVGFCSVMGIPARTIGYGGHTTGEVLLDGKWRWVENWNAIVTGSKTGDPVQPMSFLDLLNDPAGYLANEEFVRKFSEYTCVYDDSRSAWLCYDHEAYSHWNFAMTASYRVDSPRATSGMGSLHELSALYPERKQLRYKCDQTPKVWLTPFRTPMPGNRPESMLIAQEHGIRQEFHLASLNNIKAIKSCLLIAHVDSEFKHNMPQDGGDWYYTINGTKASVKDLGGWNLQNNYNGTGMSCLELTLKPEWLLVGD